MHLQGASALVTGGGSGLGLATAKRLRAAGAEVVIADLRAPAEPVGTFVEADVTDEASITEAVNVAGAQAPLRVLVTCAGIASAERTLGRDGVLPLDRFVRTIQVNLVGTFNAVRLAAAAMAESDPVEDQSSPVATPERGVIVMTASVAAFDGQIGQAAYSASKGGVVGMTLPLAREFARALIRVTTIAPGIFMTPLMAGLPEAAQASLAAQVPHPARLGNPEEFASLVEHIVQNPMLNGETIRLDGAIRMQPK